MSAEASQLAEILRPGARSYGQYCPLACALDVLGNRWTLLIVRDLLLGPQRYSDLMRGLPGIATDLLAERLRRLTQSGYVTRRGAHHVRGLTMYELTAAGRELEPALLALAKVGVPLLGASSGDRHVSAGALLLMLRASGASSRARSAASYGLELDGDPFAVEVASHAVLTSRGMPADPICTLRTSAVTMARLLGGESSLEDARVNGELDYEGRTSDVRRFLATFPIAADAP